MPQAECRQASELVAGLHNLFFHEDQQISGEAAACSEVTQGLSVALTTGYLSIFLSIFTAVYRGRFQSRFSLSLPFDVCASFTFSLPGEPAPLVRQVPVSAPPGGNRPGSWFLSLLLPTSHLLGSSVQAFLISHRDDLRGSKWSSSSLSHPCSSPLPGRSFRPFLC